MGITDNTKNKKNKKNGIYDLGVIESMKNKTPRFLIVSLISVSVLCVIIFTFFAVHMNQKSWETISKIGKIYMSGMSEQVAMHFETTIGLRLSQVQALAETIPSDSHETKEQIFQELEYNARTRDFEYLALYSQNGEFEMLYGDQVSLADPMPFQKSISRNEMKVAVGSDAGGNDIILMGIPAVYPMSGNRESAALVAGLPVSYIKETLFFNQDSSMEYYFIIRRDGSFITQSEETAQINYFDRVRELYEEVEGKSAEEYLKELEEAMDAQQDYTSEFTIYGERRHLYCTSLSYSEWYLLVFMPYGILDETIDSLGKEWIDTALLGCGMILFALLFVFIKYFDLTRQQMLALDEARRGAERANRAKSEFLSNMSHDIRTPMNAIVGMTSIAIANLDNIQQVQNSLKKISLSSKHLLGLINDILDMSKIESGKMTLNAEQTSLREIINGIVNILQPQVKAKHQSFDVHVHDIYAENVCCDSVRLNQVLINILGNAVKFTQDGGKVGLSMTEEPSPRGDAFVRVHLWIRDNGIGMTEEFKKRIFESFAREDSTRVQKTEGTGLGMAITKYIVDAMGGTIEINSEPGKGSEFHVILDLEKAVETEAEMRLPQWEMLLVDDDQQVCESTVAVLKSIGVQAEFTLDGESAVEMAGRRVREGRPYQVMLLDWKLPNMDGLATAREIRRIYGDEIPILLISAYDWGEIEEEARKAGVSGFIAKPLFKSTLYYGLRKYVGEDEGQISPEDEGQTDFTGKRILLAEDNELNWEIASELLSEAGFSLDWAENGKICVEMFGNAPAGTYDVILMDIRMPVMTGYEATRAIRSLAKADAKTIPIIAMSADAFAEDIRKCLECGMNAHIAKPIDMPEVIRILEKYIEKPENGGGKKAE